MWKDRTVLELSKMAVLAVLSFCSVLLPSITSWTAQGDIVTIAGGSVGDEGSAKSAITRYPSGVSVDSTGNIYIADSGNNRIRKVNASNGVITTIAGNGIQGYGGDNSPATLASLSDPTGVSLDTVGNIYIADSGNNRIRKVNASNGVITTVAGSGIQGYSGDNSPATLASLSDPTGVSLDTLGNIYIADSGNNRIRKVKASNGLITTVAGNGSYGFSGDNGPATSARLFNPHGVSVDSAGNIYIADSGNNRIRKVNVSVGMIVTMAGNGIYGFSGDNGPATSASLSNPHGVSVDSAGNIYIADSENQCIRMVNSLNGIITTAAGNGSAAFSGDNGLATSASFNYPIGVSVDTAGNIYIADEDNNRIRKVSTATGMITTVAGNRIYGFGGDSGPATSASIYNPSGVAVDSAGNIYIADEGNNRIRKVNASTEVITTVAGNGSATFRGDNSPATSASLYNPSGVAVDSAGNIYIADEGNNRIRKVNASTEVITTVAGNGSATFSGDGGPATSASLNYPTGVAVDSTGNIYIADSNNNRVREVNASTGVIKTVAGNGSATFSGDSGPATSASLNYPTGVAVDSTGNIYIADSNNNRVREVNASTGAITTVAGNGTATYGGDNGVATLASLNYPISVSVDAARNIYIADTYNDSVRKVNASTGMIATVAGNGTYGFSGDNSSATSASLNYPSGVSADATGNIYIADFYSNRIRKVNASTGMITTVAGNGTATFGSDNGAAATSSSII